MLNRQKIVQFFNSWPCYFPVNFLLFFCEFQFLMVRLFMIQRYITFLEIPNFLHTIFYIFLLIFINFVYKQLIVNILVYVYFCFLYYCIYCIFKFLFYMCSFLFIFIVCPFCQIFAFFIRVRNVRFWNSIILIHMLKHYKNAV
jgi:hypothetical protein